MPKVDIPEEKPIKEGWCLARVDEIEEKQTSRGDEMWAVKFRILEGDDEGEIVKDNIVFSRAASKRLRIIAKAFGLPAVGAVDFERHDIEGRTVRIEVALEDYKGETKAKVTFSGYREAPQDRAAPKREPGADDDLPF